MTETTTENRTRALAYHATLWPPTRVRAERLADIIAGFRRPINTPTQWAAVIAAALKGTP